MHRVDALLDRMTLPEAVGLLHGEGMVMALQRGGYIGSTAGVPRLGVPPLLLNDGPQGYRTVDVAATPKLKQINPQCAGYGTSTQFPASIGLMPVSYTHLTLPTILLV